MINIFESYADAGQQLPQRDKERFYTALIELIGYGKEPELDGPAAAVFTAIRPTLEKSKKRAEAGRAGGNASAKNKICFEFATEQNESKAETSQEANGQPIKNTYTSTSTCKPKGVGGTGEGDEPEKPKKPPKHKHGEYGNVLLTDEELGKLKARFPSDWQRRIDDLDIYIGKTGKSYKSHYLTIISWARDEARKSSPKTYEEVANERFGEYSREPVRVVWEPAQGD